MTHILLIDINWNFFVAKNIFGVKSRANGRSIFSVLCTSDKWVGSMLGRLVVTTNWLAASHIGENACQRSDHRSHIAHCRSNHIYHISVCATYQWYNDRALRAITYISHIICGTYRITYHMWYISYHIQDWLKCWNAGTTFQAEQGLYKQIWRAIESKRESDRTRGSQREPVPGIPGTGTSHSGW